ncbi:Lysophospholipase 1 [Puccinia graminis f. sp. tritici]|uniref:Lysophospholipase n=1 Tax=Puccinia graminis f. sp. tritici TaxID=56615 RepID=A0A5B0P0Z0_PUCGR|nr:Lysophospholipase 1 [Puccinia graminis f. sp. tritici]KAA1093689.1 Lysophospholipase 1 [Puccinia graminis f. sp. tritici]
MISSNFVVIVHYILLLAQSSPSTGRHVLERRDPALTTSPSGNYAPVYDKCPARFYLREPNKLTNGRAELSDAERNYIAEKAQKSINPWRKYLENVKLKDFDINSFLREAENRGGLAGDTLPNFGLSLSGGGGRALCLSGSILEAFDSRNPRADAARVGGILQLSNYAVGVSGASWLLGAWGTSNFPPISDMAPKWRLSEQNDLWDWNVVKHYRKVYKVVKQKKLAGFATNIIDVWGRLLSRLFIDDPTQEDPNQGEGVLWSSISQTPLYKDRQVPYVISVATSRPGIKEDFTPYSPIYEFSAEEFGVFHPRLNVSIPMQYLGSPQNLNGVHNTCVRGFDNAGFIMGLSSNIYSMIDSPNDHKPMVLKIVDKITDDDNFEGKVPNTFQNLGQVPEDDSPGFQDNSRDTILMADCGFINESIPIYTLLQPERKIDAIIAVDASTDGKEADPTLLRYPNGTALFSSYSRTLLPMYRGRHMPKIPSSINGSFTDLGYHRRPTFFGCNDFQGPLIIYLPNYYAVGETNQPTSKTTYTPEEIQIFYENGFAIATQNAGPTRNPDWPACLACALIDRQVLRNSASRTAECQACFQQYCAKD